MNRDEAIEYFAEHGRCCEAGGKKREFVIEVQSQDPAPLEKLRDTFEAGRVYGIPSRNTHLWRVYGRAAVQLWAVLRLHVSPALRERGDAKLARLSA